MNDSFMPRDAASAGNSSAGNSSPGNSSQSNLTQYPSMQCPAPRDVSSERISLAHGEGGRMFRHLLREHILPILGSSYVGLGDDAALLPELPGLPVISTDSFVVTPLFFPGGDIGTLAVYGTINDLAVRGAQPSWLTLSLVIEEGLPLDTLRQILASVAQAARQCGVMIVAGDTKVVPRGAADGLFINTTGLGYLLPLAPPGARYFQVGDQLLLSGPIGRHGIAVLAARESLGFDPPPISDCGSLLAATDALRAAGIVPRAMRDATRGGVAAVLHEWADDCELTLAIDEARLPVSADVRGACELLGLDPLHVANEGTMMLAVRPEDASAAVETLRATTIASGATIFGTIRQRGVLPVVVTRGALREQPLDDPLGAPLPRIC